MLELSKEKRLIFKKGDQKKLLLSFLSTLQLSQKKGAQIFEISPRSFSDWINEKTKLPLLVYKDITKKITTDITPEQEIPKYWYASKAGKLGFKKIKSLYGHIPKDEKLRKKNWNTWWNTTGKKQMNWIGKTKQFTKPKLSEDLAELFGVILGDGGITDYQLSITLNSIKDKKYASYLENLIENNFGVKAKKTISEKKHALTLQVSRLGIIKFLIQHGLVKGNKKRHQVSIPVWIKQNRKFSLRCLRGLIDTDGCIFLEKQKRYLYPRLNFVNSSKKLVDDVDSIMKTQKLSPVYRRNGNAVQVENYEKICDYMKIVGSSNERILLKWQSFLEYKKGNHMR